jgi:hypothetical protein
MCVQECIGLFDNRTRLVEVRVQCGSLLSIGANYQCKLAANPETIQSQHHSVHRALSSQAVIVLRQHHLVVLTALCRLALLLYDC